MGVELVADKCSVNVLLKESGEVKAGKGFRGAPATCSCGAGRLGGRGPRIHVGCGKKSGAPRRRPAGGCGGRAGRGVDPGRQEWGKGGRRRMGVWSEPGWGVGAPGRLDLPRDSPSTK